MKKSENNVVIKIINLKKNYKLKQENLNVLDDVNVSFENGKFYVINGHSGSGKSTLIRIIGLIDNDYTGKYIINNNAVNKLSEKELANIRAKNIGFIFQDFLLNKTLKAYENVMVPMLINNNILKTERKNKAMELLKKVGLEERANHYPKELSGGEQQRVAIARALANDPNIILADEPTGNLDIKNEKEIFEYLKQLSIKGKCVIVVSHSKDIQKYADKVLTLQNGKLCEDSGHN